MLCSIQMAVGYFLASLMSVELGTGLLMQLRSSPSEGSSSDNPNASVSSITCSLVYELPKMHDATSATFSRC